MPLRCFFLDLNSFFASVEQAENPSLRGRPVAVVPMLADTTCCIAASYEAKACGVKTGTMVADARRLCPKIILIVGDHRTYVSYHHRIIETVDKYLPVSQVHSIDEMSVDLIGREREESYCRAKAAEIKQAIYREVSPALSCSIGIAPNKFLAKVASDMQKPDGLVVIHDSDIPQKLFGLELRDLPGIGAQMEKRFLERRCLTVKQLYNLTIGEMRDVWGGINGEIFWRKLRGEDLKEKDSRRSSIGHSRVLAPKSRKSEDALTFAVRLLSKACMRLREEDFFARELQLDLKFISNDRDERYWFYKKRFAETQDTFFLTRELEEIWPKIIRYPVLKVGVTLSGLVPANRHQLSLFEDQRSQVLMQTLDSINRKYKKNMVYLGSSGHTQNSIPARIAFQHIPKEEGD